MKKDRYCYPAVFTYEDGQEIAVEFPDLGTATCGTDDEDALKSAQELLGITILGMEEDGEEIPAPTSLHELHLADNQSASLIDVFMPSIRLASENKAVTRTVTVPAWLNARAQEYKINFSQTLQEALKAKLGI